MVEPVSAILIGLVLLPVVAGALDVLGNAERRLKRKLKKAPLRAIRHLPDRRYARFIGVVGPLAHPIAAPLTGRACAFWCVVVEEKRNRSYRTVLRREQGRAFTIDDGTGRLLVHAEGAKLALVRDGTFASGFMKDATPELERFLAEHGEKAQGLIFNRDLRYYEAVVEPGERVAVAGIARAEHDPDAIGPRGERETPMRMVLEGGRDTPLIITDDPHVTTAPRVDKAPAGRRRGI